MDYMRDFKPSPRKDGPKYLWDFTPPPARSEADFEIEPAGAKSWVTVLPLDWARDYLFKRSNLLSRFDDLRGVKEAVGLVRELGWTKFYLKPIRGTMHLVLKGWPNDRSIFTASHYLADNAKLIEHGVGRAGAGRVLLKNAKWGVLWCVAGLGVDAAWSWMVNDQERLKELGATWPQEIAKALLANAAGALAGAAVVGTSVAALPVLVGTIVAVGGGMLLDYLDNRYHLSDRIIAAMKDFFLNSRPTVTPSTCRGHMCIEYR